MTSGKMSTLAVLSVMLLAVSDNAVTADRSAKREQFTLEERSYWAFQPVGSPKAPSVRDRHWVPQGLKPKGWAAPAGSEPRRVDLLPQWTLRARNRQRREVVKEVLAKA